MRPVRCHLTWRSRRFFQTVWQLSTSVQPGTQWTTSFSAGPWHFSSLLETCGASFSTRSRGGGGELAAQDALDAYYRFEQLTHSFDFVAGRFVTPPAWDAYVRAETVLRSTLTPANRPLLSERAIYGPVLLVVFDDVLGIFNELEFERTAFDQTVAELCPALMAIEGKPSTSELELLRRLIDEA